jgi:hypothetical protein
MFGGTDGAFVDWANRCAGTSKQAKITVSAKNFFISNSFGALQLKI